MKILLSCENQVAPLNLLGRFMVWLFLVFYGFNLIFKPMESGMNNLIHFPNLGFHEAGHLIFSPFGEFVYVIGGSLGQLLMPLVIIIAFLFFKKEAFGSSVALWWFGQNMLDIAPYINDARLLELQLLGGGTGKEILGHDWEYLLSKLGWLRYDYFIANIFYQSGRCIMILAITWGLAILIRQLNRVNL